jgi:class 3 adenylate cyclase
MTQPIEKLAVLFADVCGSTALYESLGDSEARRLITQSINAMINEVSAYQGTLIKTIGDEIMCTFPGAEAAFHAACAMQIAVESERVTNNNPLHIRIGYHFGDVILESGDVFGDTVNTAARVASITRADQIMTTQAAADALSPDLQKRTRHIQRAELKGKQEHFDIFIVIWEMDESQSTRIIAPALRQSTENNNEMNLCYRGLALKVSKERKSVALGRGDACDLPVQNSLASRLHLRVELRFGKFILVDQSTNGTYIRFADGSMEHIIRAEIPLLGNGVISLGQSFAENPTELVEFSIVPYTAG